MSTSSSPTTAPKAKALGWRDSWYPLAFVQDFGTGPQRFTVHDAAFVLYRDQEGEFHALEDRCPHRGARLSDGTLHKGRLECLYHGWRFDHDGRCVEIPQLRDELPIPGPTAIQRFPLAVSQGILWLWPNAESRLEPVAIPTIPDLDRSDCQSVDFSIDLPYDQTFLVENVIDLAHIHVAHDGIRGGGRRELAAPLEFELSEIQEDGFHAFFRSIGIHRNDQDPELAKARVEYQAPNLIWYTSVYAESEWISGLALYSVPTSPTSCRLLYRAYSNFRRLRDRWRPRWVEHGTQCTILEQDMNVVLGQAEDLVASGRTPRETWFPLKSSDQLVIAYRQWLDRYASTWPYRIGFAKIHSRSTTPTERPETPRFDRFTMHTRQCASCKRVHDLAFIGASYTPVAVALLLSIACLTLGSSASLVAASLAILATGLYLLSKSLLPRFRSRSLENKA